MVGWLQENIFYTPEQKQKINTAQRQTAARNNPAPAPSSKPSGPNLLQQAGNFLQDNIFYTPEKIQQINAAHVRNSNPKGNSALPSLRRGDDIPASQYPEGVSTGVGGGNAAQSVPKLSQGGGGGGGGGNTSDTGRGEVRTNAKGVVQQGTQTGVKAMTIADANGLLSGGYQIENPFASNSLPATNTSAYKQNPQTTKFDAPAIDINTGARQQTLSTNLYASGGAVVPFGEKVPDMPTSDYVQQQQSEGSPKIVQSGAESAQNSGINWGARTMADNSDKNMLRRQAFMDGETSADGLRNVEAQKGIVYAGQKHYMVNPNKGQDGQNDFLEISADDKRAYMGDRMGAQELAGKYVKSITESKKSKPASTDTSFNTGNKSEPVSKRKPDTSVDMNKPVGFEMPDANMPSFGARPTRQY